MQVVNISTINAVVGRVMSSGGDWLARIVRFPLTVVLFIPLSHVITFMPKVSKGSRTTLADEPPPHPLLIPNPNPKPWETLFEEHEPVGEDFLAVRPTMVAIKDGRAIFKQPDE